MKDIFLVMAGCLGMVIAILHGYIGEMKVVRPIQGSPASAKRVLHALMFLSAVYWFVGGAILAAGPFYLDANARYVAAMMVGALYLSGAIANLWATRGRHFGWAMLAGTTILIWLGV